MELAIDHGTSSDVLVILRRLCRPLWVDDYIDPKIGIFERIVWEAVGYISTSSSQSGVAWSLSVGVWKRSLHISASIVKVRAKIEV